MLFPVGTDAPIYHRGWSTIGIIVVNTLIFFLVDPVENLWLWLLEFGAFQPQQWIASSFTHGDILHLGGNMLFLWIFGQIVEGRLGWWRFLALYLGIAAAEGMATQILMLGADGGGAFGASGVIFGLMAITLVWPHDYEIKVFFFWSVLTAAASRITECRLTTFVGFWIAWNVLWALISGFTMSSQALHLIGAAMGVAAAFLLRMTDWVYTRDWEEDAHDRDERWQDLGRPAPAARGAPESAAPKPPAEDLPPLELD